MPKIDIACIIDDDPIFVFGTKRIMEIADFLRKFYDFQKWKRSL